MSTVLARPQSSEPEENEKDLGSSLARSVLSLEKIDTNFYRGNNLWRPKYGRAVYGGQVIGQALAAAGRTKPEGLEVHSLHCYFIRPGKSDRPILYHIDRLRDGSSFSTRSVKATQNGDAILTMMVSYHKKEPSNLVHQFTMPEAPPPDELLTDNENMRNFLEQGLVPEMHIDRVKHLLATELPIESKPVDPAKYYRYDTGEPRQLVWVRANGHIGDVEQDIHRCVAAYMSDWTLLRVSLAPFRNFRPQMMASLDHAMWFHTSIQADEWLLYESESPKLIGARAFTTGRLWKQDGTLAVSVAQEGVVRGEWPVKKPSKL